MSILMRREPRTEAQQQMTQFRRELERLFGRWALDQEVLPGLAAMYPTLNLREDDDYIYAEAELPGQKLDNLEITITGENRLTIRGERKEATPEGAEWHRRERGMGAFERTLDLPIPLDSSKVGASLENGVLMIKIAKSPQAKPRKIQVKAG